MGNDEICHFMEVYDAGIHEASGSRDREQGVSSGHIDNHNVGASRIDSMSAFCVGDDRSGKGDVVDRGRVVSPRLGERHYGAAP